MFVTVTYICNATEVEQLRELNLYITMPHISSFMKDMKNIFSNIIQTSFYRPQYPKNNKLRGSPKKDNDKKLLHGIVEQFENL